MRSFVIVWSGQLVSAIGSALSGFALAIWAYQTTGSTTVLSLLLLAATVPAVLLAPVAGALVDRWDRRTVMLFSDAIQALATALIAGLILSGQIELWHLFLLLVVSAVASAFQSPAFQASIRLLVPEAKLGRANGLDQLKQAGAMILAPVLAGALVVTVGIGGVLLLDVGTFLVALVALLAVKIPRPPTGDVSKAGPPSLWREIAAGWSYLRERPALIGLLAIFSGMAFLRAFVQVLYIPLMLSFTSEVVVGATLTLASLGLVLGGALVALRGVPRHKVRTLLGLMMFAGLMLASTGLRPSVWLIASAAFATMCVAPLARAADQVLWQKKTAPRIQGRVFALRRMSAQAAAPVGFLLAGPLADRVFEPAMAEGGPLAASVGTIIGVGAGRGIGLMFVIAGVGAMIIALAGYGIPRIRRMEHEIPDAP